MNKNLLLLALIAVVTNKGTIVPLPNATHCEQDVILTPAFYKNDYKITCYGKNDQVIAVFKNPDAFIKDYQQIG